MRILQAAVLITILFIASGESRPGSTNDNPVDTSDGDDYPEEDSDSDSNLVTLNTSSPPSHILSKSVNISVNPGDNVTLPCRVSNPENVVTQWLKGLTELYADSDPSFEDATRLVRLADGSLLINNFKEKDVSDKYICQISSTPIEKIVHSVRMNNHVYVSPSESVDIHQPNTTITLSCRPNFEFKPKIKWSFMGQRIESDSEPKDGSNLTLNNISGKDDGLYQCLIETTNEPEVRAIHVHVPHAPKISVHDTKVYTGMHMDAELTCEVDAVPQAEVTWFKDNKKMLYGNRNLKRDQNKHTLVITRVEKSHFGKYTCMAVNEFGNASEIVELTGIPRPAKFIQLETKAGQSFPILVWEVQSYSPILKYELKYRPTGDPKWQIANPAASDDGTRDTFVIKHPLEGITNGNYEAILIAQNEFGWSETPAKPISFKGYLVIDEPEPAGSRTPSSSATSTQSVLLLRSLLLIASILVSTTYL